MRSGGDAPARLPLVRLGFGLLAACATGCVEDAYRYYQSHTDASRADAGLVVPTLSVVCSDAGWCWENPLPHGNPYAALWAASAGDVWAVGGSGSLSHWDGALWQAVASPTEQTLRGAWGSAPTDVWAVGDDATLLHWDGTGWQPVVPAPGSADSAPLRGVWGSAQDDVWAVGDEGAFHWDGGAWDALAATGTSTAGLAAVWGDVPSDYWAVGAAGALHYDGTSWSSPEAAGPPLTAVWAGAGVWATGAGGVFHRDAPGQWSTSLSCTGVTFLAVWGTGTGDVWAAGTGGALWHFDGGATPTDCDGGSGSWAQVQAPTLDLEAGVSLSPQSAWVGGAGGTIAALNGGTWQLALGGHAATFDTVWVGAAGVFAAGTSDDGNVGFFERLGTGWGADQVLSSSGGWVTSMAGSSPSDLWAVDDQGRVWHREDAGWDISASLPGFAGLALFERSDETLWAGGNGGALYEPLGLEAPSFVADSTGLGGTTVLALWGEGNEMWAAGTGGRAYYSDGDAGWTRIPSGAVQDVNALWASGANGTFFAVGAGGTIAQGPKNDLITYDGSPTVESLHGVWGTSATDVWAVGEQGKVLHLDATSTWKLVPGSVSGDLYAVAGGDGGVWAVGAHGAVLHHP